VDLLLLDIMMGGKDGFQVLQELRNTAKTSNIPVIVVTALHDLDSKIRGLSLGANDYVTKPFHVLELQVRIRSVLDAHSYRRSLHAGGEANAPAPGGRTLRAVRGYQELPGDLEYEYRRAERYGHPLSLILLALDDTENDKPRQEERFQPSGGGAALAVFQRGLRSVDLIYRLQEDQFVLLLPETSASGARVAANRLRDALKQTRDSGQPLPTFTAAMTSLPHGSIKSSQELLTHASHLLKEERWRGSDRLIELGQA
jgi:PleD family two-component response regulator